MGLPVVSIASGEDVAEVRDVVYDGEAHRLVGEVTEAYEAFDSQRVGRLLATYVDDLSNWYVRRSRRRFWDGDPAALSLVPVADADTEHGADEPDEP